MTMKNLSNILTLTRVPLALVFLIPSATLRCLAIILAMATDALDGYFARRFNATSPIGTILDPLMDKFFVFFALTVFILENSLLPWQMAALLCRDFSIILFGLYLYTTGRWAQYQFRAIWCGKVTTALQFVVMLGLSLNYAIPSFVYTLFIALGFFALVELYLMAPNLKTKSQ